MAKRNQFAVFLLVITVYIAITFLSPTDPSVLAKYHISQAGAYLLNLAILLPLISVWFVAFYGYITFKHYASIIKDTPDGQGLHIVSLGLMILAFSLPIVAVISGICTFIKTNFPQYTTSAVISQHFLKLAFTLAAFLLVCNGAQKLAHITSIKNKRLQQNIILKWWLLAVIMTSCLFTWLIIVLPQKVTGSVTIYSMPTWFILLFLVVPYLYAWCKGVIAVYYLNSYRLHVKGYVYRNSIRYLVSGLALVIVLYVSIQVLGVLTPQLQRLNFTPVLLVVYGLIALYALAYGLIAAGAKKLKKIEEV